MLLSVDLGAVLGQSQPPLAAAGLSFRNCPMLPPEHACQCTHLISLTQQHGNIPFPPVNNHPLPHLETGRIWKENKVYLFIPLQIPEHAFGYLSDVEFLVTMGTLIFPQSCRWRVLTFLAGMEDSLIRRSRVKRWRWSGRGKAALSNPAIWLLIWHCILPSEKWFSLWSPGDPIPLRASQQFHCLWNLLEMMAGWWL